MTKTAPAFGELLECGEGDKCIGLGYEMKYWWTYSKKLHL